jgi:hypothetical protein
VTHYPDMSGYSILTSNVSFPTLGDKGCRALSGNFRSTSNMGFFVQTLEKRE